jgi:hypothetical protein
VRVFLSYPTEERDIAERVQLALRASGHDVFFDRASLPPGAEYDRAIAAAINSSALVIFLVTPAAFTAGRYMLTELGLVERKWSHPNGRVLPVAVRSTPITELPPYIRAVTVLQPRGDAAAETAYEVERLRRARSLPRRLIRGIRTPVGIGISITTVVVAAAIAYPRMTQGVGNPTKDTASPPSGNSTSTRLTTEPWPRAITVLRGQYGVPVAVLANPPALWTFARRPQRWTTDSMPLFGDPVAVVTPNASQELIVATRTPDVIEVLGPDHADSIPVDPKKFVRPAGMPSATRLSGDIKSVARGKDGLWIVTGERDGDPSVLRFRQPQRQWVIATWPSMKDGFGLDARGLRLRSIGEQLWAVTAETTPSSLYAIDSAHVQAFDGHDVEMVSCAHDLAESPAGNLLFLSCENDLMEARRDGDQLRLIRQTATAPSESARGNWTSEIIAMLGDTVFVALNTEVVDPRQTPSHLRIVVVRPNKPPLTVLDERDAIATSIEPTVDAHGGIEVYAILARLNGRRDAVRIPIALR